MADQRVQVTCNVGFLISCLPLAHSRILPFVVWFFLSSLLHRAIQRFISAVMIFLRLQSYEPFVAEPKIPQAQTQTLDNVDRVQFKVVFHGSFPGIFLHQLVAFTYFVCLTSSVECIVSLLGISEGQPILYEASHRGLAGINLGPPLLCRLCFRQKMNIVWTDFRFKGLKVGHRKNCNETLPGNMTL